MNAARKLGMVLVFAATSLWAQKPPASPAPPPSRAATPPAALTFTIEVTDKAGHRIPGLQQSDFTLLDDKSPSPIQAFAAHSPGPRSPETAVVVVDTVNMGFVGDSVARGQIIDFLRKSHGPLAYGMSLLVLTDSGISELGTTSDDPATLLAELNTQQGQLRDIGRSAGFWGAEEREEAAINSLSLVARTMGRMRGRKLLIWIGPGWPIFDNPAMTYTDSELHQIFAEVVTLSREMTEARVTLYDVDPLGTWDAGTFRTFLWQSFSKPVRRWDQALPGNLALQVLATQSGGLVLNSSNDVAGELNTCSQDGAAWYTISFAPQTSEKPDTWHSVKVKLDKPGLIVRTRPGYYAEP
ncbi:MAG TPA: VWA domain-containing protein [Acidobacteriaceae bacterium]|nr:VWA domain-containing protein [Acidobacteriaceae bacterium]